MVRNLLFIALSFLFAAHVHGTEVREAESTIIYMTATDQSPQITLNGQNLRVRGAAGMNIEIYNVTGVRVATKRVESNDQTLQLGLSRGCYIIKIGRFVRKITIL